VIPLGARLGHPIWRKCLKEAGVSPQIAEDVVQRISESYVPWQENSFPGLLGNVVAGRIAKNFNFGGTNCVIDAACASALSAIHVAALELKSGRSDMVITGGVDTFNDVFMFTCFNETQALSPSGQARPFDAEADGTILGEGIGILVLKRLEDARRDNDRIYAVIRGIGTSSDGREQAIYAPNPTGQAQALRNAYQDAGVTPDTIELIEAHGTGTKAGDTAELTALVDVYSAYGDHGPRCYKPWCAIGSVKSQIGHTKAAAGAAGIIKAALALYHKVLPPTIKVTQPAAQLNDKSAPFYINTQMRPWLSHKSRLRRAGVSSFGFGGSNFHCVLEEDKPERPPVQWDQDTQILCFSSETLDGLMASVENHPLAVSWKEQIRHAQESRNIYNGKHAYRLLVVLQKGQSDMAEKLKTIRAMTQKYPEGRFWSTRDGIFFGSGDVTGKLGMVFPGQGSQYVGMLRDLSCLFPQMQQVLEEAEKSYKAFRPAGEAKLLTDYIYPHPVFSKEAEAENERSLRATQIAQPSIGAVSLGALNLLKHFGVAPDAVAGHSYGELTALCASQRLNISEFFTLSFERGRLMAGGNGDKGSMLAVQAPFDLVAKHIKLEHLDLTIANRNAPNQMVLSGKTQEIKRASQSFDRIQVRNRILPVSGAFHSPLVEHVKDPFQIALRQMAFKNGNVPVFANSTAGLYPQDPEKVRNILAEQLIRPVEFTKEIENMVRSGISTFLEVGPSAKLAGLIQSITQDNDCDVYSMDGSSGRRRGLFDLASCLAFLSAKGYNPDLKLWAPEQKTGCSHTETKKPQITIPLCGTNYVNPTARKSPLSSIKNSVSSDHSSKVNPSIEPKPDVSLSTLADALRITQENMAGLQKLQEQTNQLHKQFLEGQAMAQRTFQSLVEQQHRLIQTALGDRSVLDTPAFDLTNTHPAPDPITALPTVNMKLEPAQPVVHDAPKTHSVLVRVQSTPPAEKPIEPPMPVQPPNPTETALSADGQKNRIIQILLETVAEKTGYPVEMLELDMELELDLGIDSIKRVEILSDIQEKLPEAPVVKPEHLGTLKTLRQIADFLSAPASVQSSLEVQATCTPCESEKRSEFSVSIPRFPDLKKKNPQGSELERSILCLKNLDRNHERQPIRIPQGAAVWISGQDSPLARGIKDRLVALNYSAVLISLDDFGTIKIPHGLSGLIILSPDVGADDFFIKNSFRLIRHIGPTLREAATRGGSILLTISRMDGAFGLASLNGQHDPVSGGLAGFVKTARHEWPEVHSKALDLAKDYDDSSNAVDAIIDEMFLDGPVEVGLSNTGRCTLQLSLAPIDTSLPIQHSPICEKDVVVVSGGGRGVTAEAAFTLAREFRPTLVLLGRSKPPEPEPAWLAPLTEHAEIKKELLERANGNASPKRIEAQYREILTNRELLRTMTKIESTGARVRYHSVDIRNGAEVQSIITQIRNQFGPIKGLIHGAGVLADRLIEDKTDEQFELVYTTKVDGLRALLAAVEPDDLRFMVLFSSVTGRHGRSGQIDYAVANEVLNKFAQQQARQRKRCRVVAVNWGPWDGGMVNGSLRRVFEEEGIDLINVESGAEYLLYEICSNGDRPAEVVVMGKKSVSMSEKAIQFSIAFERQLNTEDYPFLKSHVLKGRSVLPMAVIIEWMAHGAMHENPGMKFAGFDNLRILKGITLEREQSFPIQVRAGKAAKVGNTRIVPMELTGSDQTERKTVYVRAEIVLASTLEPGQLPVKDISLRPYNLSRKEIYQERLFHGPDFHGLKKVEGYSEQGISAISETAPPPATWFKQPLRTHWLADPLVLDSAFQMMILWSLEHNGIGSLPAFAGRYRQFETPFPKGEVRIQIRVTHVSHHKAVADIDFIDAAHDRLIAIMKDYECTLDESLAESFRQNQLPGQDDSAQPVAV
jgi:acyl transferase domain-containing protein/NAD(P)-dependent dehydrogenase (short-subunit alcohol dehydrogenase family)